MKKIVIIGAGNVATHIASELFNKGFEICQIFNRTLSNAVVLANKVEADAIDDASYMVKDADLYIISLSDGVINDFVNQIYFEPKLIVHTAGSIHINVLDKFKNYGVFYPLQTFTKGRKLNFKTIPICIEANNEDSKKTLQQLAEKLSNNIHDLSSEQRKQCHLAAVVANNFTNHFYSIANEILKAKGISFDIIRPLILETANKVQELSPIESQTGPAVRNNLKVIDDHKKQLPTPELEKLYSFVSQSIIDLHKK